MSVIIGRPINGIPINGLEYALDEDGNELVFDTEDDAISFLKAMGYPDIDAIEKDGIVFVERR